MSRNDGHWISNQHRRLTKPEVFRLQGMDPTKFSVQVSNKALGNQPGNAMSVNVVEQVLHQALLATTLLPADRLRNRWANGLAQMDLIATRGFTLPECNTPSHQPCILAALETTSERSFIVDSGASFNLISECDLTQLEQDTIRSAEQFQRLITADDEIVAEQEVDVYCQDLDLTVTAYLVPNTPPLLSLGRLNNSGWTYVARPGQTPTLTKGDQVVQRHI